MTIPARSIRWVMLVSGVLTFTMIYAAIDPKAALASSFGESLEGPVANVVVRNWGGLIAIVGAMLVYGASRPAVRPLVLTVAAASTIFFVGLVLTSDRQFLGHQVGVAVVVDSAMVLAFLAYLFVVPREQLTRA